MENLSKMEISKQAIIGAVVTLIGMVLIQYFFFRSPSIDETMMKAASEFSKNCPIMLDSVTRLDNAISLPNKTFQFNLTFVNGYKDSIDIENIKEILKPKIINFVKSNPDLKMFRERSIKLVYYYSDKEGNFMFKILAGPNEYNTP